MPLSHFRGRRRRLGDSHQLHITQPTAGTPPQVVLRETIGWTGEDRAADYAANASWICTVAAHNHVVELALCNIGITGTTEIEMRRLSSPAHFVVLLAVAGCRSIQLSGAGVPSELRAIRVTQVQCYVVCDSLRATLLPSGLVFREVGGSRINDERRPLAHRGGDTLTIAPVLVSSLQQILDAIASDTMSRDYRQGKSPCIDAMTTHTPVSLLVWTGLDGRSHQLRYDWGCHEPSGVPESAARLSSIAARFDAVPVKPR